MNLKDITDFNMNLQEQLNRIQEMMGINEPSCDYDKLKELSNELSSKLKCDVFGSCVHFAELFVEMVKEYNDDLLYCFDVLEGYVTTNDGRFEHTWIKLKNDEIIDPAIIQFGDKKNIKKITKKKTYSGAEYLTDTTDTWFKERREKFPHFIYKD